MAYEVFINNSFSYEIKPFTSESASNVINKANLESFLHTTLLNFPEQFYDTLKRGIKTNFVLKYKTENVFINYTNLKRIFDNETNYLIENMKLLDPLNKDFFLKRAELKLVLNSFKKRFGNVITNFSLSKPKLTTYYNLEYFQLNKLSSPHNIFISTSEEGRKYFILDKDYRLLVHYLDGTSILTMIPN
ncbi:Uncharacterised protein [Candidatus Tiddalikarchaeum anstoanum]|nr:Uncharacterised protein [Candidatus Tiddalikarchaeum anstoanum]